MTLGRSKRFNYILTLGLATVVSLGLFVYGAISYHTWAYGYLIWNLFLAWLPLLFAIRLIAVLKYKLWSSWEGLLWSVLWLLFLPNSFYMISDFIHIQDIPTSQVLYYVTVFTAFIYTAVVLGFSSLFLVHLRLARRLGRYTSNFFVGLTIFVCCFGIYLGRDLRWNSWNIFTNPGGLLFDISNQLSHLKSYPQMILTVLSFFVLLCSLYSLMWFGTRLMVRPKQREICNSEETSTVN